MTNYNFNDCTFLCCPPAEELHILFNIGVVTEQPPTAPRSSPASSLPAFVKGTHMPAFTQQLTDSQQFNLTIAAVKDKKGNTVTPSAPPTWATDNSDILTLTPTPDGMGCLVVAAGALGTANINVAVTTPAGDLAGLATITVVSGAPVTVDLTGDTPAEQP